MKLVVNWPAWKMLTTKGKFILLWHMSVYHIKNIWWWTFLIMKIVWLLAMMVMTIFLMGESFTHSIHTVLGLMYYVAMILSMLVIFVVSAVDMLQRKSEDK